MSSSTGASSFTGLELGGGGTTSGSVGFGRRVLVEGGSVGVGSRPSLRGRGVRPIEGASLVSKSLMMPFRCLGAVKGCSGFGSHLELLERTCTNLNNTKQNRPNQRTVAAPEHQHMLLHIQYTARLSSGPRCNFSRSESSCNYRVVQPRWIDELDQEWIEGLCFGLANIRSN
jgi:hypothetical protein